MTVAILLISHNQVASELINTLAAAVPDKPNPKIPTFLFL